MRDLFTLSSAFGLVFIFVGCLTMRHRALEFFERRAPEVYGKLKVILKNICITALLLVLLVMVVMVVMVICAIVGMFKPELWS